MNIVGIQSADQNLCQVLDMHARKHTCHPQASGSAAALYNAEDFDSCPADRLIIELSAADGRRLLSESSCQCAVTVWCHSAVLLRLGQL